MATKCNMDCENCIYDDCINDEDVSELERLINFKAEIGFKKLPNHSGFSKKVRKQYYYLINKVKWNMQTNEYSKKRRLERKEQGLCVRCGTKLPDEYSYLNCEKCREKIRKVSSKYNKLHQNYYYRNREKQLEYANNYIKNLRAERKNNGMCVMCGEKLPDGYKFLNCEICKEKIRTANRKYKERKK
ncbi:MAG: hypothetical protein MJ230_01705 [bacterium]|nr:hypothetical protein [bacterium]